MLSQSALLKQISQSWFLSSQVVDRRSQPPAVVPGQFLRNSSGFPVRGNINHGCGKTRVKQRPAVGTVHVLKPIWHDFHVAMPLCKFFPVSAKPTRSIFARPGDAAKTIRSVQKPGCRKLGEHPFTCRNTLSDISIGDIRLSLPACAIELGRRQKPSVRGSVARARRDALTGDERSCTRNQQQKTEHRRRQQLKIQSTRTSGRWILPGETAANAASSVIDFSQNETWPGKFVLSLMVRTRHKVASIL